MPWAILLIGSTILVTSFQGTENQFFSQVKKDLFSGNGQGGFIFWAIAIGVVGGIGYIPGFKPLSRAFLILLLIVLFLASAKNRQGGFFAAFQQQLQTIPTAPTLQNAVPGLQTQDTSTPLTPLP